MGYSALTKIREMNTKLYGIPFPKDPEDFRNKRTITNMERSCLTFIRDLCQDLRFDPAKANLTDRSGGSIQKNQIPYNMEMDIDRLCLENAVHRFMSSGTAQDAFDVYFCFLEMFLGDYAKAKKMIEMLAEFESNASALLMEHRDHYSHSAYVFILGTAIYANSVSYRKAYQDFYGLNDTYDAAHHFLRHWGFTSLFHDIGYPFELPFAQVKSYFGDTIEDVPFVSYRGLDKYLALGDGLAHYADILGTELPLPDPETGADGKKHPKPADFNSVLATRIAQTVGSPEITAKVVLDILAKKPGSPDAFAGYMDHAYFSATLLFHQLTDVLGTKNIKLGELDIFTAIVLHNSIYKRTLQEKHHAPALTQERHPLAYMLMLCDELQCWDRTSYGLESRRQLHPMWCDLDFNGEHIHAHYYFDKRLESRKEIAQGTYQKMVSQKFQGSIESLIRINHPETIGFSYETEFIKNTRLSRTYLSSSSFLHLYNFAVALNSRYQSGRIDDKDETAMEADFDALSLEYKLSNVMQAKAFSRYLDSIGCFYTDKPVVYEPLDAFSDANMDVIGPMEHARWVDEKRSMGWSLDDTYTTLPNSKQLRELTRTHCLMIDDYAELDKAEQDKDTEPMNCMLKLIEKYDGLRIYRI